MTGCLRLILGDQLTRNVAALRGLDPARDTVLMVEVADEARYVRHHGQLLRVESPVESDDEERRWKVIVMKTVTTDNTGVEELRQRIEAHRHWLMESGEMGLREQLRIANTLENIVRAELNRRILERLPAGSLGEVVEAIRARTTDPYRAAGELLATL